MIMNAYVSSAKPTHHDSTRICEAIFGPLNTSETHKAMKPKINRPKSLKA